MPLDVATSADLFAGQDLPDNPPAASSSVEALVFSYGAHLGEGLKAARESRRMTIQDVSDVTRIHPKILDALEALDMSRLPSRPFAIGFVRAYARCLGVDEERAVARFKADAPDANEPFRPPVGVVEDRDPRLALIAVGAALVLGAIVVWNVAQRAMADHEPAPSAPVVQAPTPVAATPNGQPVVLGQALPAPVESTVPKPYIAPGMPGAATNALSGDPTRAPVANETLPELPASSPNAPVYGAPREQTSVISLRARKATVLIVRTSDGSAIFTRSMTGGETYRAPAVPGLTFEVPDPTAMDVMRGGQFVGQLPAMVTPASRLGADAPPAAPAAKAPVTPAPAARPAATAAPAAKPASATNAPAAKPASAPAAKATNAPTAKATNGPAVKAATAPGAASVPKAAAPPASKAGSGGAAVASSSKVVESKPAGTVTVAKPSSPSATNATPY